MDPNISKHSSNHPHLHNRSQEQMFLEESHQGVETILHAVFPSTGDNLLHDLKKKTTHTKTINEVGSLVT
jgi:hypothetical protein